MFIQAPDADLAIVNGENIADGVGITPKLADKLLDAGADVVTLGNHTYRRGGIGGYLAASERVIRPANQGALTPGKGMAVVEARNGVAVAVVNLLGTGPNRDAQLTGLREALADPAVHLHLYDKRRVFERRKMGHLTVLAASPEEAARKALDARGIAYKYLEYGGYLSEWRRRNALKMWTGWPTFPMVFVKGTLVGGYADLAHFCAVSARVAGRSPASGRSALSAWCIVRTKST